MTFRDIFSKTNVAAFLKPGLQALNNYSTLIEVQNTQNLSGSVDIDLSLQKIDPNGNRWDYAFGYGNRTFYVEVHHVADSEVSLIIQKYNWLINWQNSQPNTPELKNNSSYYWISTGKGSLSPKSKYIRQLAKAGLDKPERKLRI